MQADVHVSDARRDEFWRQSHEKNQALLKYATLEDLDTMKAIYRRLEEVARAAGDLPPAEEKPAPPPLSPGVAMARMGTPPRQRA